MEHTHSWSPWTPSILSPGKEFHVCWECVQGEWRSIMAFEDIPVGLTEAEEGPDWDDLQGPPPYPAQPAPQPSVGSAPVPEDPRSKPLDRALDNHNRGWSPAALAD